MKHINVLELRSAIPLETRDGDDDPMAAATRAVEELRSSVTQFRTDQDKKIADALSSIDQRAKTITERLDAIETRAGRPGAGGAQTDEQKELEKRAFEGFIRRGREALNDLEVRTLRIADDTAGGYLAPPDFVAELIKGVVQFSPVRQVARVGNTASASVILPRRTGTPTVVWVGETQDRTETESTYGQIEIPSCEQAGYTDVSNRLLEDSAIDIAAEVASDLAEQFGKAENTAFLSGSGPNVPAGILNESGIAYTPSGGASGFASSNPADALIDLFYALPAFYRGRGTWLMNAITLAAVRKFKDSSGRYLWEPALQAGEPSTLLSRPVVEAPDLADPATNSYPIIFGDFQSGYRIYDRVAVSLLRDPYSLAVKGQTRFHARRRVGGQTVLTEAFRKLKCSTS